MLSAPAAPASAPSLTGIGTATRERRAASTTFVFAGGGTGGHIFPALAIFEEIARLDPGARAEFLCSQRPLDSEILTRERMRFKAVPARPFGLAPGRLARFAWHWGAAVRAARLAIRDGRAGATAVHVVAMGGFVAAPAVRAAVAERCPITLVNLDAVPGKANLWIARHASRVFSAAPSGRRKWTQVAPLVRSSARGSRSAADARAAFGLDPGLRTLLVTGGSQGARSVNELLAMLVAQQPRAFQGWQVIHQCGANEEAPLKAAYAAAGVPARVSAFIDRMGDAWAAADLAVSRAGAGSVAEAWANAVPSVFLPYPFHRDEHQRANAGPLVDAGAAECVTDRVDPRANLPGAGARILALLADERRRASMKSAYGPLGPANGAEVIARALLAV